MISVTELLVKENFIDRTWFDNYGATRGSYVHTACHLYDTGELDEEDLDPALVPYLDGWKKFRAETGFEASMLEERMVSDEYQFTGQPDRIGDWPKVGLCIIDIKSGSLQPWTAIQLAAYKILAGRNIRYKRFAVNLPGDGTYKVKEYKDRADEGIFLAALAIHNWKKNHGGK
jgi:hypothetical protein